MKYSGENRTIFTETAEPINEIPKHHVCCFSGHRPEKLPDDEKKLLSLSSFVRDTAALMYFKGINTFMTGMARGFDLLAAEAAAFDPDIGSKLHLICVMPYAYHRREMKTTEEDMIYRRLLKRADTIICMGDSFQRDCYRKRNTFMVNNSSALIAYLKDENNSRSGTAMTCKLAKENGHNIYMITEKDLRG